MFLFKARLAAKEEYKKTLRGGRPDAGRAQAEAAEELVEALGAVLPEARHGRGDVVERGAGSDRHGGRGALKAKAKLHREIRRSRGQTKLIGIPLCLAPDL